MAEAIGQKIPPTNIVPSTNKVNYKQFITKTFTTDEGCSKFATSALGNLIALNKREGYEIFNIFSGKKLQSFPFRASSLCSFAGKDDNMFLAFQVWADVTYLNIYKREKAGELYGQPRLVRMPYIVHSGWVGARCVNTTIGGASYCVLCVCGTGDNKSDEGILFVNVDDMSHVFVKTKTVCHDISFFDHYIVCAFDKDLCVYKFQEFNNVIKYKKLPDEPMWKKTYPQTILSCEFSPDGKFVGVAGLFRSLEVLDTEDGFCRFEFAKEYGVRSFSCTWHITEMFACSAPNDQTQVNQIDKSYFLAVSLAEKKGLLVYDVMKGVLIYKMICGDNITCKFQEINAEKKILISYLSVDKKNKNSVMVRDMLGGVETHSFPDSSDNTIWQLSFTKIDCFDCIVYGDAHEERFSISKLGNRETKDIFYRENESICTFSDDGTFIVTTRYYFESYTGKRLFKLDVFLSSKLFGFGKSKQITLSSDLEFCTLDIPPQSACTTACFTHDNKHLAYFNYIYPAGETEAKNHKIRIINLETKEETASIEMGDIEPGATMTYNNDDSIICVGVSGKNFVYIYKVSDGKLLRKLELGVDPESGAISTINFSPDGLEFAISGGHNQVCVYSYKPVGLIIEEVDVFDHGVFVNDVKYSPCGRFIGAVDDNQKLTIRSAKDGKFLQEYTHEEGKDVQKVAFSSSGSLVAAGGWDKKVTIRDLTAIPLPAEMPENPSDDWLRDNSYLIHRQDQNGDTLLHIMSRKIKADQNNLFKTYLHDIIENEFTKVVIPIRNKKGETPLSIATGNDDHHSAENLLTAYLNKRSQTLESVAPLHDSWKPLIEHFPDLVAMMLDKALLKTRCAEDVLKKKNGRLKLTQEILLQGKADHIEYPNLFTEAEVDKFQNSSWNKMKRRIFCQSPEKKTVEVDTLLVGFPNFVAFDGPFEEITQSENYDAFNTEAMNLTIKFKWQKYGFNISNLQLFLYLLVVILFSLAMAGMVFSEWDRMDRVFGIDSGDVDISEFVNVSTKYNTKKHKATRDFDNLLLILSMVICLTFWAQELREVYNERLAYFFSFWNWMDITTYALVVFSTFDHILAKEGHENRILYGWALIFLWFNILSFLRPYSWSGPLIRMIVQIVRDMRMFVLVMILLLLGFVGAFVVLQPHNPEVRGLKAFFLVFNMMLGEFDMENFNSRTLRFTKVPMVGNTSDTELDTYTISEVRNIHQTFATQMAFVLYMSLVVIILLNLLIAIMGHSYDEIREREIVEGRMEKARALVTIERTFRPWLKVYEEYYFPKHLHVLKPKIFEKQEHNIESLSQQQAKMFKMLEEMKKKQTVSGFASAPPSPSRSIRRRGSMTT